eukprot:TRINITY_DN30181_c0_g1_i4.p1 TRINITY_DN30181_c0_g1~~TRINITY_DN30181_c0_g1_i4.p1  ORF type:complete len:283 (-),score=66.32 TRINITY_DN30181_c0_g1_i4:128-976(-)
MEPPAVPPAHPSQRPKASAPLREVPKAAAPPAERLSTTAAVAAGSLSPARSRLAALLFAAALAAAPFALFQKKLLPQDIARIVSVIYFWPTVPLTFLKAWWVGNKPWCYVDETLLLGPVPLTLMDSPARLRKEGVKNIINMQAEYSGPEAAYKELDMKQLRLPTVDHFEPSFEDLIKAVRFIDEQRGLGEKVYVHCKAGHGRAAAIAMVWLIYTRETPAGEKDLRLLNEELLSKRHVRSKLYLQPNIKAFAEWSRSRRDGGEKAGTSATEDGARKRVRKSEL